jgi:hypothetical protein
MYSVFERHEEDKFKYVHLVSRSHEKVKYRKKRVRNVATAFGCHWEGTKNLVC